MAGEGDARSSTELAVKHVSWSKVFAVAAVANTGPGLAWLAGGGLLAWWRQRQKIA
jgi:hypothetical protein